MPTRAAPRPASHSRTDRHRARPAAPGPVPPYDAAALASRLFATVGADTYAQVAARTGLIGETVRRQLNGENKASVEFVAGVCAAYGVSAEWLLLGKGPRRAR